MFDFMNDPSIVAQFSVVFRIVLAAFLGAAIGIDRVKKRRPAGIKTHALVSMGAALVMLTDQFIWKNGGMTTNLTRMSAQVISGVGFLGAGTIMVTGRNQIKGLTTAAGLWFAACLGLAIGSGFYLAAMTSMVMLYMIVIVFSRFDQYLQSKSMVLDLYIEYDPNISAGKLAVKIRKVGYVVLESEHGHSVSNEQVIAYPSVLITVQVPKNQRHNEIIEKLYEIEGIKYIEEV